MSGSMSQVQQVGKQRLVLDLSCRKRDGKYYVVTDRWQRFSELIVNAETLSSLGGTLKDATLAELVVILPRCQTQSYMTYLMLPP